jgi:hypothetical protein
MLIESHGRFHSAFSIFLSNQQSEISNQQWWHWFSDSTLSRPDAEKPDG